MRLKTFSCAILLACVFVFSVSMTGEARCHKSLSFSIGNVFAPAVVAQPYYPQPVAYYPQPAYGYYAPAPVAYPVAPAPVYVAPAAPVLFNNISFGWRWR